MATQHSAITDTLGIHEPKGISTATSGRIYIANGSGSGAWSLIGAASLSGASIFNINQQFLTLPLIGLSSAHNEMLLLPEACTVVSISGILTAAVTTVAPVITCTHNGSSAMGTFTLTIPGVAGDRYNINAPTNNTMSANDYIQFGVNGGTTGTANFIITVKILLTA